MPINSRGFNLVTLSFGFMFVFTAFQTLGNLEQTVLQSVAKENPDFTGSAYTSLSIIYGLFAVSNWFAPSVISIIGSKICMIIGCGGYLAFVVSFLYPTTWLLYTMSAIVGVCAALAWTAQGNFLSTNAGPDNMTRHSGIFWAIFQCSLLIGNIFVYCAFYGKDSIDSNTRYLVFSVLSALAGVGVCVLFFLRRPHSDEQLTVERPSVGPVQAFKDAVKLFFTLEMILFSITFFFTGIELSFWSGVYSASIGATLSIENSKQYVGMSGIFLGLGEISGGLIFGIFGKKTVQRGREPVIIFGILLFIATYVLIYLNIPNDAVFHDTHAAAKITSNVYLAIACSYGLGLADSIFNTQIFAALGTVFQDDTAAAFAIFKCTQSIGAAIAFGYSLTLSLYVQLYIQIALGIIGTITFVCAEIIVRRKSD